MDEIKKHPFNVQGKYYVDDFCLDHECCAEIAPKNFKMDEEHWSAFVFKQPTTDDEEKSYLEAMITCPIEAIHNDG